MDPLDFIEERLVDSGINLDTSSLPYCVVYTDADPANFETYGGGWSSRDLTLEITTVGRTKESCRAHARRLTTALEGWKPVIPGRNAFRMVHFSSEPVVPNYELPIDKDLWIGVDIWRLTTVPGTGTV